MTAKAIVAALAVLQYERLNRLLNGKIYIDPYESGRNYAARKAAVTPEATGRAKEIIAQAWAGATTKTTRCANNDWAYASEINAPALPFVTPEGITIRRESGGIRGHDNIVAVYDGEIAYLS